MSFSELLIALENIIIDKVARVPAARHRKIDTPVLRSKLEWRRKVMVNS